MRQNEGVSALIDTTEMYLKTVFELEEEGITPLRARIAERLAQSGPTVSQTVARMERDGLLTVEGDRHLELTRRQAGGGQGDAQAPAGRAAAHRRHRSRLELVHEEACRWEHVVSEHVERRLVQLLEHPTESPYGNPIPSLAELGEIASSDDFLAGVQGLARRSRGPPARRGRGARTPDRRAAADRRRDARRPAPGRRDAGAHGARPAARQGGRGTGDGGSTTILAPELAATTCWCVGADARASELARVRSAGAHGAERSRA